MKCTDLATLALDYMDGVGSPADRAEIDEHLSRCAVCRDELASLAPLWYALGANATDIPSASMRTRVIAAYAPSRWSRTRLPAAAAAALLIVGGVAGGLLLRSGGAPATIADASGMPDSVQVADSVTPTNDVMPTPPASRNGASGPRPPAIAPRATAGISAHERLLALADCGAVPGSPACSATLLHVASHDDNAGVRIAAVDALRESGVLPQVIDALAASLRAEASPVVQAVIVDALGQDGGAASRRVLAEVARGAQFDPTIRRLAEFALAEGV